MPLPPKPLNKGRAFLQGMARTFDLFGSARSRSYQDAQKLSFEKNDKQAILKDWKSVSDSIRVSIAVYTEKYPLKK